MKKLVTVISILFLTAVLSAKEFAIPSFNNSFEETLAEIKQNYDCNYNDENKYYEITGRYLRYYGVDIERVILTYQGNDDIDYSIFLFFNDINTDLTEYVRCVFNIIKSFDIKNNYLLTSEDTAMIVKMCMDYNLIISFDETVYDKDNEKMITFIKTKNSLSLYQ